MPCKACRREAVARMQEIRRRRMVQGKCIYCGIDDQEPDHWGCRPCLEVKRAKRKRVRPIVGYEHTTGRFRAIPPLTRAAKRIR